MEVLDLEKRNGVRLPDGPATVIDDEHRFAIVPWMRRPVSKKNRKSGDVSRLTFFVVKETAPILYL